MEVFDSNQKFLGALQKRFAVFHKSFDVENACGDVLMEVRSPIWKLWTFPFSTRGVERAFVRKKWSGAFSEFFSDRDNFVVEFDDPTLSLEQRSLILAAALYVDLEYFEQKAQISINDT